MPPPEQLQLIKSCLKNPHQHIAVYSCTVHCYSVCFVLYNGLFLRLHYIRCVYCFYIQLQLCERNTPEMDRTNINML